ncbi:hypothetical protein PtB15_12B196 [Puccinia triticina]|nr:hypothetical protein PtB15_12B196 [Puccinia triticina]
MSKMERVLKDPQTHDYWEASVLDSLALHVQEIIRKRTIRFVAPQDRETRESHVDQRRQQAEVSPRRARGQIAGNGEGLDGCSGRVLEIKSIALGGEDENMLGQIVSRIGSYPIRRASVGNNRQISLTTKNLRLLSAQDWLVTASPCSNLRLDPHKESEFETEYSLGRFISAGGYYKFLGTKSEVETISDDASALSKIPDDDERTLL